VRPWMEWLSSPVRAQSRRFSALEGHSVGSAMAEGSNRRQVVVGAIAGLLGACAPPREAAPVAANWSDVEAAARGQAVRWNAWAVNGAQFPHQH
jgi:hypothetical protein